MAATTSHLADDAQRELALDLKRSFIIQAPAGSGKTTLLVQRYLALLKEAKVPEEILAITFTRKAAAEMQNRVLETLSQKTTVLAEAVWERDQKLGWQISDNPHRLRIQTIDSLCHSIVKKAPLLSNCSDTTKSVQDVDAYDFYHATASDLIRGILKNPASDYYHHLEILLLHLDNDFKKLIDLCISMLKCREQWLPHIISLKQDRDLRQHLEAALAEVNQLGILQCEKSLPQHLKQEINVLVNFSAQYRDAIANQWLNIAQLLLTKTGSWRKEVTSAQGFPAPAKGKNKYEQNFYKDMKERAQDLLTKLNDHEDFRKSLAEFTVLPPAQYDDRQWQMISALLEFLKVLAAELKVTLHENNVTDHPEVSMMANYVLGQIEAPSEVALNLDLNLKHILIDEFQDTSYAQYRLLEKLIGGWQPNDGRTLFIVGDPMQSIYLFRDAEVGLFLKTQRDGIGAVKLEPLTLTTNFRSTRNLVEWVNDNLSKILPSSSDLYQGAVSFSPSIAASDIEAIESVTVETFNDADDKKEADMVVNVVQEILKAAPTENIAILVKTRNHLRDIIPTLKAHDIDYQAIDLDTLNSSIVIQDLFALTRALFSFVDVIAWLAILRAPWCGLGLKDLHAIANGPHATILENMRIYQDLDLTQNGLIKLQKFVPVIDHAASKRFHLSWRDLLEDTWLALEGPAVLSPKELEHPQLYLDLLDEQRVLNLSILEKKLDSFYAPSNPNPNVKLTIMTIHKAKGLEFDHVIIPSVNRRTRQDEQKLLLWQERPSLNGKGNNLILAPIKETGSAGDSVYDYLKLCMERKNDYEAGRLLYVATTRAKKSLHLFKVSH